MRYLIAATALSLFTLGACANPKVLVGQEFLGRARTTKLIIQKGAGETFDTYVRICNLLETGEEKECQDTLVLSNVNPNSVY